ncbi:MAG: AsmA family protein [Acidobacteriaceae bacterium]
MVRSWVEATDYVSTDGTDERVEAGRATPSTARWRRRWLWACALLVVLLLVLTPPLVNVNRLQRRIAASISLSLGRPVHLDSVTLHLLPMPGFELQNLVVSEDPAFGSEPTIRANTVDVTLRPSSLWRRHVEFSTISFDSPSVNLVRNAQGQWNLQSLLMHAAQVNSAPTAQRRAGPEPRFPYIEASGARMNLKLGEEKTPFSLTDADFSLWLNSAQQWQVRLRGTPARTDRNLFEPGTIQLEGWLRRAATMAQVPIDLSLAWDGAPLGEASVLLRGADAGWRGKMSVAASLSGTLDAARLRTTIHLEDLRRADFVPVETLDVQAVCGGTLDVTRAVLQEANCAVATPRARGAKEAGSIVASAESVQLPAFRASDVSVLRVAMAGVPNTWLLDWARLFSQRIPPDESPGGTMAGSILLTSAQPKATSHEPGGSARRGQRRAKPMGMPGAAGKEWQGSLQGEIVGVLPWKGANREGFVHPVSFAVGADGGGGSMEFVLAPFDLTPPGKTGPLVLSGTAGRDGYTLKLTGMATGAQVGALRALAPPLGDGLKEALPEPRGRGGARATQALKIDVTCMRSWGGPQGCSATKPEAARRRRRRR